MKLRFGQRVQAIDGLFGEVGDIVIDPKERSITHLVVEPHHQHQQARLVPMWLVAADGDDLRVGLGSLQIRRMQRVAFREFVTMDQPATVGDGWDLGTEDVVALPVWDSAGMATTLDSGFVDVAYDRVPKGECEVRQSSEVLSSDDRIVGHVDGFLAEKEQLVAVVVRTGFPGFHRNVVVPIADVATIKNDELVLNLDKREFERLPIPGRPDGATEEAAPDSTEHESASATGHRPDGLRGLRTRHLLSRLRSRHDGS